MTRDDLNMEMQRIWMRSPKTVVFVTHSIPEAVFLSDRVAVMARNPGELKTIIELICRGRVPWRCEGRRNTAAI